MRSTEFVKKRLDKLSTVVVEVASFIGYPVVSCHLFNDEFLSARMIRVFSVKQS